jgi:hypothetical protein
MADDLDVLGLLRKYEHMDKLKKQAADEIERLNLVMVHLDKVCNLLVAELLRNSDYRAYTTTTLLQEFVYRAVRGD